MADKPNFIMIPDDAPAPVPAAPARPGGVLARLRTTAVAAGKSVRSALTHAEPPPVDPGAPGRPCLVFAVDATASREPAWATARGVTVALVKALPGELAVALAIHGGSRVHTFTEFTTDANTLRDRAAGVACSAGLTRLLPILSACLKQPAVRVVVYIGDVFEESLVVGHRLADRMGVRGTRLIVLHDTVDTAARRGAEVFWDLAKRTGGCVLPFDSSGPGRLREVQSAVAAYAVGGEKLLRQRRGDLPGAVALLKHLSRES